MEKTPKKRVMYDRMAIASNHAVGLKVHGGVGLDMVALVDGTGEVDRVILIPVDAEDLLGARGDLANVVHQLPPIRVA